MSLLSRAALAAVLTLPVAGAVVQEGLPPVEPEDPVAAPDEDTRADRWRERLREPDLDRREQHFGRLIEAVRRTPRLRTSLEAWAADTADPELAWTARLALRELARQPAWGFQVGPGAQGFGPHNPWFSDPFQAFRRDPGGGGIPDLESLLPEVGAGGSESFRLSMGPDGVRLEVTRTVDGESSTTVYEGESLEALLEANPELESKLRGNARGFALGRVPLFEAPRKAPAEPAPVRTDVLGVFLRDLTVEERQRLALDGEVGLYVEDVADGTIAALLGLRQGHVLVELNGRVLKTRDDVTAALAERDPEGEVTVVLVDRAGRRRPRTWRPAAVDPFEDL
jgi:hypothetical protein